MAFDNTQQDGRDDVAQFLARFKEQNFTSEPTQSADVPLRAPSVSGRPTQYEHSFEKLEQKIQELEKRFELSSGQNQLILSELARTRQVVEHQQEKDSLLENLSLTIANLKASVEQLSHANDDKKQINTPVAMGPAARFGQELDSYYTQQAALNRQEIAEKERLVASLHQKASQLKAVNSALDREIKKVQQEKLDALKKSAEQAKEILSLRDQLTAVEERFKSFDFEGRIISIRQEYQQRVNKLEVELKAASDTCMQQVEEIENLRAENINLQAATAQQEKLRLALDAKEQEVANLQADIAALRADHSQAAQQQVLTFTAQLQTLQAQRDEIAAAFQEARTELAAVHSEKDLLEKNVRNLIEKIKNNDVVISQLKQKISVLTKQNNLLSTQNSKLNAQRTDLSQRNTQLTQQNETLRTKNAQLTDANQVLQAQNGALLSEKTTLQGAYAQLETTHASLQAEREELAAKTGELTAQNEQLSKETTTWQGRYSHLETQNTALSARNTALAAQNSELSEQNAQLSSKNTQLAEQNATLTGKNARLFEQNNTLSAQNNELSEQNSALTRDNTHLQRVRARLSEEKRVLADKAEQTEKFIWAAKATKEASIPSADTKPEEKTEAEKTFSIRLTRKPTAARPLPTQTVSGADTTSPAEPAPQVRPSQPQQDAQKVAATNAALLAARLVQAKKEAQQTAQVAAERAAIADVPIKQVFAPKRSEVKYETTSAQDVPVQTADDAPVSVQSEADLPEIRVADPVPPQNDTLDSDDFLEKTDSFLGRMKWSIFRDDR